MTTPADQVAATLAAYQSATGTLRANITAYVGALWRSLGEYREQQMADFVSQVTPVVSGAQQQMASLTAAYLAAHKSAALGVPLIPLAINPKAVTGASVRNGVEPSVVYGRPFHTVWRELGAAKDAGLVSPDDVQAAIDAGLNNAVTASVTDLQLTKTHTSRDVIRRDKRASGYRRVLEGPHSCGLCIVASTQRYHKAALLPMHPACDCSVDPVYDDTDEQVIDDATLAAVHAAIAGRFGKSSAAARQIPGQIINGKPVKYSDVLIVHDHGELGPVLTVRGQKFLGPSELN